MLEEGEIPDDREGQPAQEEAGCEEKEDPAPVEVDERDEDVLEELVLLPVSRALRVQESVLSHDPVFSGLPCQHV